MKKFKLTTNKKEHFGRTLYQIESLINFGSIHVGDLGGWVEKEENLYQECNAWVGGNARVYGDAEVGGDAWVGGNAEVCGNAEILWISKIGSRLGTTTAYRNKDGGITITCGCFLGTLEEFEKKVTETHGDNKFAWEYNALVSLIKIHFEV